MSRQSPLVFVMAAGLGTRMKSETPKVLHKIAGRPMLHWVVTAARAAAYGFTYKSAISSWTGHAVCSGSAWLNGLNIFNTTESYHPNRNGNSQGYAPLVRQVIG